MCPERTFFDSIDLFRTLRHSMRLTGFCLSTALLGQRVRARRPPMALR